MTERSKPSSAEPQTAAAKAEPRAGSEHAEVRKRSAKAEVRKGSVKEAIGKLTGDPQVEAEGRRQKRAAPSDKPVPAKPAGPRGR